MTLQLNCCTNDNNYGTVLLQYELYLRESFILIMWWNLNVILYSKSTELLIFQLKSWFRLVDSNWVDVTKFVGLPLLNHKVICEVLDVMWSYFILRLVISLYGVFKIQSMFNILYSLSVMSQAFANFLNSPKWYFT